jgi:hypothetical protein
MATYENVDADPQAFHRLSFREEVDPDGPIVSLSSISTTFSNEQVSNTANFGSGAVSSHQMSVQGVHTFVSAEKHHIILQARAGAGDTNVRNRHLIVLDLGTNP